MAPGVNIKPNIENGDPVCSGRQCPDFADCPVICIPGEPCLPAIKKQKDAWEKLAIEIFDKLGHCPPGLDCPDDINVCTKDIKRQCWDKWLNYEVTKCSGK